jgi:hypothetical protein
VSPALSLGVVLPVPVVSWPALVSEAPAPLGELRLEPADEPWPVSVPVEPWPVEPWPWPVDEPGEEPWPEESVGELWGYVRPEFGAWKGTGRVRTGLMPAPGTGRVRPAAAGVLGVCTPVEP